MRQEAVGPTPILNYAVPAAVQKPRRWWLLACFIFGIIILEDVLTPRLNPPGWPLDYDKALMLLLPIGAVVMSTTTSLPGWIIGLFGLVGACPFLLGQLTDNMLPYYLSEPHGVFRFLVNWCMFLVASWLVCRCSVLLRRRQ